MAQSSISRYRLAILAATALAAGCSLYYIREHFLREQSHGQALRRSNAVHRPGTRRTRRATGETASREPPAGEPASREPRTRVSREVLDMVLADLDELGLDHLYGNIHGHIGPTSFSYELKRNALPSAASLQETFHLGPDAAEQVSQAAEQGFIQAFLSRLVGPRNTIDRSDVEYLCMQLESRGLRSMPIQKALATFMDPNYEPSRYYRRNPGIDNPQGQLPREDGTFVHDAPDSSYDLDENFDWSQPDAGPDRASPNPVSSSETLLEEENESLNLGASTDDELKNEGQSLLNLLYYIAEDQSRKDGYIHRQVTCNQCNTHPIRGIRYRCANCVDYDLCEQCESTQEHTPTHIFYKVRIPAPFPFLGNPRQPQPVWYPGKPASLDRQLSREMVQRLSKTSKFEDSEIAALWDQFRCLASQPNNRDPFGMAIDHSTFDRCFMPNTSLRSPPPNLIYDLMFSFYDTDGDGLIGFEEFVTGLACLRERGGKENHEKLRRIFSGYDLDRDGFVSRKDFLRMFRAYYALMKELTRELVAGMEDDASENGQSAREIITSSQPLSAAFHGHIPRGQPSRTGEGKTLDRLGDLILPQGQEVTRDGHNGEGDHHEAVGDIAEFDGFGDVARPFIADRVRTLSTPETPEGLAELYNLGDRIFDDQDLSVDNNGVPEYTPNDDRNFNGAIENPTRAENVQGDPMTRIEGRWIYPSTWPPRWVDPADTEIALGRNMDLKDVTDPGDRSKVAAAAMERMAQEDRNLRQKVREGGVFDRWQRRRFYLDEEDGATKPERYDKQDLEPNPSEDIAESINGHGAMNGHPRASRRSRSSSKVRFEDDVMDEPLASRSRSSTSVSTRSIPIGERWGGFEIPEPEKDVGREVLYQVTHEALNEMLDPIFKYREDLAMEVIRTQGERAASRLEWQSFYDRVPRLEEFVSAELHELLRYWRTAREKGLRQGKIQASDCLRFLQDFIRDESISGKPEYRFFSHMCEQRGMNEAHASFQPDCFEGAPGTFTAKEDQTPQDDDNQGSEPKPGDGTSEKTLRQQSDEEPSAKASSPDYVDDPNVAYPEPALELQDAVSAFNAMDSASTEATIGTKPLSDLLAESGYAVASPGEPESSTLSKTEDHLPDPTLPQNRPNSREYPTESTTPRDSPPPDPNFAGSHSTGTPTRASPKANDTRPKPSPSFLFSPTEPHKETPPKAPLAPHRIKYCAFLDCIEKEDHQRGGPGRMNYEEFEQIMTSDRGRTLSFVGAWIDLASF